MRCTLCGSNKSFEDISRIDAKSSTHLVVSMCGNCGLVQQIPIPLVDELRTYYSHNYRDDYKNTYTPKAKHIYRAGKTAIQRICFLKEANILNGTLLDIGAGGGEFVYLSGVSGFQSQGVEPSIGYSEYANSQYGCDVATGELEDTLGKYDVITLFHVLEHLSSPVHAFEKLHSLLNRQGKLFVEVPWIETNDASPHNIYFKAHIFYFSVDTLVSCASQFFNVLKIDTSSNLRILFEAKKDISSTVFPSEESVARTRKRLGKKGWIEYILRGKGYSKPIKKIASIIEESSVHGISPKKILRNMHEITSRF